MEHGPALVGSEESSLMWVHIPYWLMTILFWTWIVLALGGIGYWIAIYLLSKPMPDD